MKTGNTLMHIQISIIIAILTIFATYAIVHMKTKNISKQVVSEMLILEYNKVGGKANYDKITSIQKEQIIKSLDSYQGGANNNQAEANNYPAPTSSTIDLDIAKKVTKQDTYILGNPDAEITFVEYSDLECPFCKKLHQSGTIDKILEEYDGKVNFVFKQFPLGFHVNAPKESEAALCVGELGGSDKYYEYVNTIFERTRGNGTGFALDALTPLARELGIDESRFQTCLDSGKYAERVQSEMSEGTNLFGITGTPGNVLINNKTGKWDKLPGAYPFEAFKQKIDALLKQ